MSRETREEGRGVGKERPEACREARKRLLDREDGGPSEPRGEPPRLDHLQACDACRAFAARLAVVDASLLSGPEGLAAVPDVSRRVVDSIMKEEAERLGWRIRGLVAAAGMGGLATVAGAVWGARRLLSVGDLGEILPGPAAAGSSLEWLERSLTEAFAAGPVWPAVDSMVALLLAATLGISVLMRWVVVNE